MAISAVTRKRKSSAAVLIGNNLGITFFCFLSNTYRVRHTTLRQTLADFRADNQKTKLLKIFDNNDAS